MPTSLPCPPCPCRSTAGLAAAAARGLLFPPELQQLARRVARGMGGAGRDFNGVHLRLERDLSLRAQDVLPAYIAEMRRQGFGPGLPCLVASGLMTPTYNDSAGTCCSLHPPAPPCFDVAVLPAPRAPLRLSHAGFQQVADSLVGAGVCSRVVCKEQLLPAAELEGECMVIDLLASTLPVPFTALSLPHSQACTRRHWRWWICSL